jgi:DNA polymerase III subunit beta
VDKNAERKGGMKIQILKENLHKAAALAARFATAKAQLPVLSQVVIEARKEGVFFWATDLEIGVRMRIGGKVLEPGEVAVPAKVLAELAASLPLGAVELSSQDESLTILAGTVTATIQGMSGSDFPRFGEGEGMSALESVPLVDLERVVDYVAFSLSQDESRPVLTGMLWELSRGVAVATDGYRLSLLNKAFPAVKTTVDRLVVNGGMLREAVRALSEVGEKEIRLSYNETQQQLMMLGGDVLMMGRVLGGDYPDYKAILPADPEVLMVFDREELMRGMRTAAIFARESAHIVRLELREGKATLSANAPQVGSNSIDIAVEMKKTGSGTIAFNGKYVSDMLSHMRAERVVFGMSGPLKPGLWMEEGNDHYRHVIMPVRVREGGE